MREEERRAEGGGVGCWTGRTAFSPAALLHGVCGRGVGDRSRFPLFFPSFVLCHSFCDFFSLVRIRLGGGQRGAYSVPPRVDSRREIWVKKCAAII